MQKSQRGKVRSVPLRAESKRTGSKSTVTKPKNDGNNSIVAKPKSDGNNVGIKKRYMKVKDLWKVTFKLPKRATGRAENVSLVGDFNAWSNEATAMKMLKNGDFSVTLDLKPGEYQFRYLIDKVRWENDWRADKYVRGPFGNENSVVVL